MADKKKYKQPKLFIGKLMRIEEYTVVLCADNPTEARALVNKECKSIDDGYSTPDNDDRAKFSSVVELKSLTQLGKNKRRLLNDEPINFDKYMAGFDGGDSFVPLRVIAKKCGVK